MGARASASAAALLRAMAGMSSRRTSISSCVVGKLTCGPPARPRSASAAAPFSSERRAPRAAPRAPSNSCAAAPTGGFSAPRRGARVRSVTSGPQRAAAQMAGAGAVCVVCAAPGPDLPWPPPRCSASAPRSGGAGTTPPPAPCLPAVWRRGATREAACQGLRAASRAAARGRRALAASRKYGANLTCDLNVVPSCATQQRRAGVDQRGGRGASAFGGKGRAAQRGALGT